MDRKLLFDTLGDYFEWKITLYFVKSTGLVIEGGHIQLTATGVTNFFAKSSLCPGVHYKKQLIKTKLFLLRRP